MVGLEKGTELLFQQRETLEKQQEVLFNDLATVKDHISSLNVDRMKLEAEIESYKQQESYQIDPLMHSAWNAVK